MFAVPHLRQTAGVRHTRSSERPGSSRDTPLFAIATVAIAANVVASAAGPALVASHPLWLLVLDARNRDLVLAVGAGVGAAPFFLLGIARGLVFDPLFFLLGRRHGDEASRWLAAKSPRSGRMLETVRSLFERAGSLVLFISPNSAVCLIAGQSKMPWRRFAVIDTLSTLVQVSAVWLLGSRFREPLAVLVQMIGDHALPFTVLSTFTVAALTLRNRRRRLGGTNLAGDVAN